MLDVRMVIPGLPLVAPDPLAVGLGGSETAGLQLAAELVRQGHRVTIAGAVAQPFEWRGVRLQGGFTAEEIATPHDVLLVQREEHYLRCGGAARARFLWLHDLPDASVPEWSSGVASLADRFLAVSGWQAQRYVALAPELADRFTILRNGIDLALVRESTVDVERHPKRIIYASRPERGLQIVLERIFPEILAAEPDAALHIATYDCRDPDAARYYAHLRNLAARFGSSAVWHPPLAKPDLYRLLASAGLYLYPTPAPIDPAFAETSCIIAAEALAAGLPWISTDRGALPEMVGDAGVLIPIGSAPHAAMPETVEAMVAAALRIMRDPEHAERLRTAGSARAQGLSWAEAAAKLVELARETAARRQAAPTPIRRSKGRICIATPVYGCMMHSACTRSLLQTSARLHDEGWETAWFTNSRSSIRLARNELAAMFLSREDATHVMWIDADVSFPANAVSRLLAHNVDVVGALYPLKELPIEFPANLAYGPQGQVRRLPSGAAEAKDLPGGFVLVRREVYLAMMEALPQRAMPNEPTERQHIGLQRWWYDFYAEFAVDKAMATEDFAFCHTWRSLGGTLWADLSIRLTHHGQYAYSGDPMTLVAAGAEVGEAA